MMKSRKKEFKRKYFGSLTHQLILISICLVTGTLLLCWFINTVFLEPYYVINKQNTLLSGFETIDEASEAGTLDDGRPHDRPVGAYDHDGDIPICTEIVKCHIKRTVIKCPCLTRFIDRLKSGKQRILFIDHIVRF